MEPSGKQHIAAVAEAYTRQCMKKRASPATDEGGSAQGRTTRSACGTTRACHSDDQFAASELMNGRESRPNNLVCPSWQFVNNKHTHICSVSLFFGKYFMLA